ncbi:SDR family oxidoreductase [Solicola gregarius]|uniref:SDR family oxidoreductase n=1 Tax=Solicola gregarius TaxID=2908642 RepID=A0AA46TG95_9ACTN|nr:SDR family oxidoreductase [Solicola gregarius]UYM04595.1 SDR family oxidoreductase [Solicola gregarius]
MLRRTRPELPSHAPRSAVVTGAAGGIGRAVAQRLVDLGYAVVVTDVDAGAAETTSNEIGAVDGCGYDVTDEHAATEMARRARGHAPLGLWVCNAGVGFDGTVADQDSGRIRSLVDVNLLGVLWGARATVAAMREQARDGIKGGDIAMTASLSAHGPVPGLSVYAATKAAVLSLATSMDSELRKDKIRVHAICPDGAQTALLDSMAPDGQGLNLVRSGGRLLHPDEVADALVAMVGTRRVYRTLPVRRGLVMRATSTFPAALMSLEPLARRQGARSAKRSV